MLALYTPKFKRNTTESINHYILLMSPTTNISSLHCFRKYTTIANILLESWIYVSSSDTALLFKGKLYMIF